MREQPEDEQRHGEHDYRGAAVVSTTETEIAVNVVLRGNFQPIDGRFHWYGRAEADEKLDELTAGHRVEVVVRTPHGAAAATLSAPDPWNRYRVTGLGRPPFPVDTELSDLHGND